MKANRINIIISIVIAMLIISCKKEEIKVMPVKKVVNSKVNKVKPVFGYRFKIHGDFDGDGKQEVLVEHYISNEDKKETNKYYDGLEEYYDMVDLVVKKDPKSYMLANNNRIDTLQISSGGQLFGVSYIKNEGDLNGDGND